METSNTMSQVEAAEREKFELNLRKINPTYDDSLLFGLMADGDRYSSLVTQQCWLSWKARAALASQQEVAEGDYKNMWLAAVSTLAKIDALLGLPEDGCNDPDYTLSALQDYMAGVAEVTRTDVPYTLDDVRAWIKQGQDRAASQQEVVAPVGTEKLAYVIAWLEGGCDPLQAAKELRSIATPPGAGGAGVMDARPDSVYSDSGECDRVRGPGEADAENQEIELTAQVVYESWSKAPGYVPWQAGGNPFMQDEARRLVRAAILAKGGDQGEGK